MITKYFSCIAMEEKQQVSTLGLFHINLNKKSENYEYLL